MLTLFSASAQETVYPLNSTNTSNGSYIKDIDNQLDYFIGTWTVTWDNKTTVFTFQKKIKERTDFVNGKHCFEDLLIGKFKTTDNNGNIIEETDFNSSGGEWLRGNIIYNNGNSCDLSHLMLTNQCVGTISFNLTKIAGNPNQLQWEFEKPNATFINCTAEELNINVPKTTVILTKVP